MERVYDPAVEEAARNIPRLDVSDATGARAAVEEFLETMAAQGFQRPTDDRVEGRAVVRDWPLASLSRTAR